MIRRTRLKPSGFKFIASAFLAAAILFFSASSFAQESEQDSPIGYETVDKALTALKANPAVTVTQQGQWTVATEQLTDSVVIWSFPPEDHLAHPSAVRREIIEKDGKVTVDMTALCQAIEFACDQMFLEFKRMDEKLVAPSN